ncbi:MAG: hypothetical protein BWY32_00370 [bacterium ADurb.Bin243]|nr:MAG: hypothetical protein BWY32_00370 [bacterium ADurb.Bin243]
MARLEGALRRHFKSGLASFGRPFFIRPFTALRLSFEKFIASKSS